jgi:hypothetical protein
MSTTETGALAELRRLRERVAAREAAPGQIEAEKRRAVGAAAVRRADLQNYHAELEPGAKPDRARERALMDAIRQAEDDANIPWDDRQQGAQIALEQARQELVEFIQGSWDELAAELTPQAVAARDALAEGLRAFEAGLNEWDRVWQEWPPLLAEVGVPVSELPSNTLNRLWHELGLAFPGEVPAPMPAALAPLTNDNNEEAR